LDADFHGFRYIFGNYETPRFTEEGMTLRPYESIVFQG